jgi:hypothetical protein
MIEELMEAMAAYSDARQELQRCLMTHREEREYFCEFHYAEVKRLAENLEQLLSAYVDARVEAALAQRIP